jgi:hypothetical protein
LKKRKLFKNPKRFNFSLLVKLMNLLMSRLSTFLVILLLKSNEAFQGNFLFGIQIRNQKFKHPGSGPVFYNIYMFPRIAMRQNFLISLREDGRSSASSGGVSEQVYKEFDQAVEINDLLLVEDLIMVLNNPTHSGAILVVPNFAITCIAAGQIY